MYRLLATDMDGTLLSSRRTVSRANAVALRKAAAAGIHVTLCTGRGHRSAQIYGQSMGFRPYVVSANGAVGHDPEGRLLFADPMEDEVALALIRILREHGLLFHLFTPDGLVAESDPPWLSSRRYPIGLGDLLYPNALIARVRSRLQGGPWVVPDTEVYLREHGPCTKFFCQEREPGTKEAVVAAIRAAGLPVEVTASGSDNVEFNALGVSKATGLARLAAHLGLDPTEVIAVGDHLNDLAMLSWAGMGIALANAVPEAKEAARQVLALSNDEDAVAAVVNSFISTNR